MKRNKNKDIYDVIILGTGPAGLQAAIYTARSKLKTLVLGNVENTRLLKAHLISNYFGFPEGVSGEDLLEKGIKQARSFKKIFMEEEVIDIVKKNDLFMAKTSKEEYQGRAVLLATGVKNSLSGALGENSFIGKGISFCVACDGSYFTKKKVAVLGEGGFAAKEALELLRYTKDVIIYSNGEEFNISEELKKKLDINNIRLKEGKVKEFFGMKKLQGIILENKEKVNLDGVFIAKGTPKASDFAYKLGVEIFNDYVKTDDRGKTNIEGIFAAGDVIGLNLQVSFAVGSGSVAALSIISFLARRKGKE